MCGLLNKQKYADTKYLRSYAHYAICKARCYAVRARQHLSRSEIAREHVRSRPLGTQLLNDDHIPAQKNATVR